jgi:hypothetical protein
MVNWQVFKYACNELGKEKKRTERFLNKIFVRVRLVHGRFPLLESTRDFLKRVHLFFADSLQSVD